MKLHKQISNNGLSQPLNSPEQLSSGNAFSPLRVSNEEIGSIHSSVEKNKFSFFVWRPDVYLDSIPEEFEEDDDTFAMPDDSEFV